MSDNSNDELLPEKLSFEGLLDKSTLLTPELQAVWQKMKPVPHRPHRDGRPTVGDGWPAQALYFDTYEAGAIWALLATNGLTPGDYLDVYTSQTGKLLPESILHEPHVLNTRFSKESLRYYVDDRDFMTIHRGIDMGRGEFDIYARQRILNQHEHYNDWCWLCRGNSFIMALHRGESLRDKAGVPTPYYQLPCVHQFFKYGDRINAAKSGRKSKAVMAKTDSLPF